MADIINDVTNSQTEPSNNNSNGNSSQTEPSNNNSNGNSSQTEPSNNNSNGNSFQTEPSNNNSNKNNSQTELLQNLINRLLSYDDSEEIKKYQHLLLLRAALETEVKATRIPEPRNITEVGGYYNLLADLETKKAAKAEKIQSMLTQIVSSALGLPTSFAPEMTNTIASSLLTKLLDK